MRIKILRDYYCSRCPIVKRSPRSTGVKMLLQVTKRPPERVLDFGCTNWRNAKYLESLGAWVVRVDALPDTRPDVVAYTTHMPFRDKSFNAVLLTHILMFLESKDDWEPTLRELIRISREYIVIETYRVKHKDAILYTIEDLMNLLKSLTIVRRNVRNDMQNFVIRT